jgi:hypothetical protein
MCNIQSSFLAKCHDGSYARAYAEAVGSRMCFMTCTRPDLAQALGALSRFVPDPRIQHWTAVKRVLRYLVGTLDLGSAIWW